MSFKQFLVMLNARKKIAIFAFFITVSTTVIVSLILPKTYEASTSLVLNYGSSDPVTGLGASSILSPSYIESQVSIIKSHKVVLKVIDSLNLHTSPSYIEAFAEEAVGGSNIRNWIADSIMDNLIVFPSREGGVIIIAYRASNPKFAALMANTFAEMYIEANIELKVAPSKRNASWFKEHVVRLKGKLLEAKVRLSNYQREKGIVSVDERLDIEKTKLSLLSQRLVSAQSELLTYQSRRKEIKRDDLERAVVGFENDSLIRETKVTLLRAETKRAELRQRVSSKHPDYQTIQAEIINLKSKLQKQLDAAVNRLDNRILVAERNIQQIEHSIDSQKNTLFIISENRNKLDILQRDVDDSKQFLSMATARLSQIELESKSQEGNVSIVNSAITPVEAVSPNMVVNVILSIVLGFIFSLALAVMFELANRRVRVSDDVLQFSNLPVLATVLYYKSK